MNKKHFRPILLYEFKKGSNASEAARNVNDVFGLGSVSERQTRKWFQKFRSGDETLEDRDGRGRHTVLDDDRLRSLVEEDPRKTVRKLAEELEVSYATVDLHLKKIGKTKKLDSFVLRNTVFSADLRERSHSYKLKINELATQLANSKPDLNPIEHLWYELQKAGVQREAPTMA